MSEGMAWEGMKYRNLGTLKSIHSEPKLDRDWPFLELETPAGFWLPMLANYSAESNSVPAETLLELVKGRKLLWVSTARS